MKEFDEIVALIRKDLHSQLSAEENAILQDWAARHPAYEQLLADLRREETFLPALKEYEQLFSNQASTDRMRLAVQQGIGMEAEQPLPRRWYMGYKKWVAAAAVLIVLSLGWLYLNRTSSGKATAKEQIAEIKPGSQKATLTLADGNKYELNNAPGGIVADGQKVKYADSSLVSATTPAEADNRLNILSTAQGGQYRIVLPDGSKVWLNAMTTLKYPTRFAKGKREVELDGEAYFEVDHDPYKTGKTVPFIVKSRGQEVRVLGTTFNINAYTDEELVRTTLVQGSVQVTNLVSQAVNKLKPGMQSDVKAANTLISTADVFNATAWKDGFFSFRNASLEDLMKQLRRWYGVEVSFEGTMPVMRINGEVNRNMSANKVFEVLDYLEVSFRIEHNRIIISNKK
jgi:transmembrane sensor